VEMEQKTCTIRLEDKFLNKKGILFFQEGELLDARANDLQGEKAAYEIFSWDQVNLSIQNGCALKEKRIHCEMQHLILEAARRKDEDVGEDVQSAVMDKVEPFEPDPVDVSVAIKEKIEAKLGPSCGLEDIYQDKSWDSRLLQLSRAGVFFNIGEFEMGYIDRGAKNDFIVLPGENTTVISVNPKCPRDKLLRVLSE